MNLSVRSVPVPATSQERNPDSSSQLLLLPSLVCVYRKRSESLWAAETRLRKAVVCAVKYLSAIGIHDRPVYGMITDGSYAAVIFAFEKPEGVCACLPPKAVLISVMLFLGRHAV